MLALRIHEPHIHTYIHIAEQINALPGGIDELCLLCEFTNHQQLQQPSLHHVNVSLHLDIQAKYVAYLMCFVCVYVCMYVYLYA